MENSTEKIDASYGKDSDLALPPVLAACEEVKNDVVPDKEEISETFNLDAPPKLTPAFYSFPRLSLRRCSFPDEYWAENFVINGTLNENIKPVMNGSTEHSEKQQLAVGNNNFITKMRKRRKKYSNPFLCTNKRRKPKNKPRTVFNGVNHSEKDEPFSSSVMNFSSEDSSSPLKNGDNSPLSNEKNMSDGCIPSNKVLYSPHKKVKRNFFSTSFSPTRGYNGWEDSLRQRPSQVDHFQSSEKIRNRAMDSSKEKISESHRKAARSPAWNGQLKSPKHNGVYADPPEALKNRLLLHKKEISTKKAASLDRMNCDLSQTNGNKSKPLDAGVGEVVWAKLGSTRWWPAIVVWGADCGQSPARIGHAWVFWFGDHKISELPRERLQHFISEFPKNYSDFAGKVFDRAVVEALVVVANRGNMELGEKDFDELIRWAKLGFKTNNYAPYPFAPDSKSPIPETVHNHLKRIKALYLKAAEYDVKDCRTDKQLSPPEEDESEGVMRKVRLGELKLQDICIGCNSYTKEIVAQHPLFHGGLCESCKDDIVETMFAYGDDGASIYCVICSQPGELLICDNPECNRCYCTGCIDTLVTPGECIKVLETSPWLCYLCNNNNSDPNCLIQKKHDWQQSVMQFFQPPQQVIIPPSLEDYKEKKGIRVLSLFDGIGTGRYVLDQLKIEVEAYFASEIDQDAINVSIVQHQSNVTHIGRIESITDIEVAKLCPVDLIIGGSPCNDLSRVNPARKGLLDPTGTGKLFFDFYRILKTVQLANQSRHVFWLYENVASMPLEYKALISRFLMCEPVMIDSKYFSPQNRARFFWGNVPGMYTNGMTVTGAEKFKPLQFHQTEHKSTLDDVLIQGLNRKALVEKIKTVTTRSSSLKQGKRCIMPVTMNGEGDVLWVTELEELFGFPRHYTDVGNIPLGRRQQLLGKAWSVPVIKHLLAPLRNFFRTTCQKTSTSSSSYCSSSQ